MGDRSNIVIEDSYRDGERVYLYGHWMGDEQVKHAVVGLKSGRLNDSAYLARIIFSSMVADDLYSETGFGISTYAPDNEYPILVISNGNVWYENANQNGDKITPPITAKGFLAVVDNVTRGDYGDIDRVVAELNGEVYKEDD